MTTPRMLAAATALATVLSGCGAGTVTGTATTPVRSVATAAAEQEADLADRLRLRIDMRQVGVRDAAKLVGALGRCGQPACCAHPLRAARLRTAERTAALTARTPSLPARSSFSCRVRCSMSALLCRTSSTTP